MFQDGFPDELRDEVATVADMMPRKTYHHVPIGVSEDTIHYFQDTNVIRFPYRMYYVDSSDDITEHLTYRQKMILHCMYSRSCDGFVRQKHIRSLLQMDYEDWAIPYIVKISDEYVVEIVEMMYGMLKEQDTERIKRFCLENCVSFCKSYQRMISYWNEFYRYPYNNFHTYIGRKLYRECFGYTRSLEHRAKAMVETTNTKNS